MKQLLTILFLLLVVSSCSKDPRKTDEVGGERTLNGARAAFVQRHYDEARDSIQSLRTHFRFAFNAREKAILLLDSIELQAAQDSLNALPATAASSSHDPVAIAKGEQPLVDEHERLSVKVKFFQRKLQEDLNAQTTSK